MAHLKSSEGLGSRAQRFKPVMDGRTAAQAGTGALRFNTTTEVLQTVVDGEWLDVSQNPSYTAGGNYIGDGSDG